ncbi:MAG TPA: hypothetical protein VL995_00440 [Cellvibrio sp.]|nr:hypothetical protein [Cellvibrio sp.]
MTQNNFLKIGYVFGLVVCMSSCQSSKPSGQTGKPFEQQGSFQRTHGGGTVDREKFIQEYDSNSDGILAKSEFEQTRAQRLMAMDINGDKRVDENEYVTEFKARIQNLSAEDQQRQIRQAHVRFNVLDSSKNGDLTVAEYADSGARIFSGWDLNKDGSVSSADPLPEPRKKEK